MYPLCAHAAKSRAPLGLTGLNFPAAPTVVIDAGHGGHDLGTKASRPYCEEKRISLLTARAVKKHLIQRGYRVIMTRDLDVFIPLAKRAQIANKASSSIFVSLHYNSSPNTSAQGIEIFFFNGEGNGLRSSASKKLAESILSQVIRRTKASSRGIKKGNFYVIRETQMPAVLLEGGFISNEQERKKLKESRYIEEIARGVTDGVDQYFKAVKKGLLKKAK